MRIPRPREQARYRCAKALLFIGGLLKRPHIRGLRANPWCGMDERLDHLREVRRRECLYARDFTAREVIVVHGQQHFMGITAVDDRQFLVNADRESACASAT